MIEWHQAIARLEGAYSDHTLRSYRSDFSAFENWCITAGGTAVPADPSTVAGYLDAHQDLLKPSTLRRRVCAIRKIHRLCSVTDPTEDEAVLLALRRARRRQPSRPSQALGITATLRNQLFDVCSDDLIGHRDKVLVSVGFDTLCRRGELVALSVGDFTLNARGCFTVLVRRAKNDPDGAGRTSNLSADTTVLVQDWLEKAKIERGPLLRSVYNGQTKSRFLQPLAVTRVLKKLSARAELNSETVGKISGHSLRVGAAQQLTMNGLGILPIMRPVAGDP